jgi:hypothetical protein
MEGAMEKASRYPRRRVMSASGVALVLAALLLGLLPDPGRAAVMTFGSPLAVPASKDTAYDLSYSGADVQVPGSVFHIPHDGADTALWNTAPPHAAPASGQVTSVRLEGCARQPAGAPAPLTEIHFQDLVPLGGGAVRVNVTTQAFDIPVCGQNGANGSTVTTYAPTNFCVAQGDYVNFNDEGGFVPKASGPPPYPSGVPYMVIGSVAGSTMTSFIRNGGVNNGTTFAPSDSTYHDGFAVNPNEELMLQATLATGPDATPLCPGGTRGVPASRGVGGSRPPLAPIRIGRQTIGVNHSRIASVAIYCRPSAGCRGVATLSGADKSARNRAHRAAVYGTSSFALRGNKTGHVPIRVSPQLIGSLRHRRKGIPATLTVSAAGATVSQTIVLRIF